MKQIQLGKRVRVSDPCYGTSVWCSGVVDNVKEGTYNVDIEISDENVWGERVKSLTAIHSEYTGHSIIKKAPFEVGVDSGQAGIYDEDYYKQYHSEDDCNDDWYHDICQLTDPFGTKDDKCVVSSSGYGDGGYDCFLLRDKNNEVVGFQIVFIEDEEEDEDYDEYEDEEEDEYFDFEEEEDDDC
jgi:hypothetical protein